MNKVILLGRIARDVDTKTTASGQTVARMTIAVNRMSKDKGADFIGLTAWGKTAEFAGQYLSKGRQILIEGRIQTGTYEKDGQKVYKTDVIADRIEFADSRPKDEPEDQEPAAPPF